MKILLSWLNEYGDFADPADASAVQRLADTMTALGLAVEEVRHVGGTVDGVITAQVKRLERHPDAAKVQRVWVDAGDGAERHVWCGAFNMQVGDVVPLATLGTAMPDGRLIERRGILGIDSEGMLCAGDELALVDDAAERGILVLPAGSPLGVPYGEVLGVRPDVLFDLDLTRNRPDCWGYVGVARDVAARMGIELRLPQPTLEFTGESRTAPVDLVDGERCGRFTSTVISGVRVAPSAPWMQQRLAAAGMRPISNVVDVSNYVMLELNQPTHAYDLDTLGGGGFRIRAARDGETIVTLDGVERTLAPADILICDALDAPIGVGGVMGGLDTEITDATTSVALEAAWFRSLPVMQTRRGSACVRRRRLGTSAASIRTSRTRRSPGSSSCCARRAPTWSSTPPPSTPPGRACPRRTGRARSGSAR
jgi:phenylalanyl-tRNA synthetase beta chain